MPIIKPFGKPVVRAMVVIDQHGQISIAAARIDPLGVKDVPLSPLEACSLLTTAVAGTLQALTKPQQQPRKDIVDNGTTDKQGA